MVTRPVEHRRIKAARKAHCKRSAAEHECCGRASLFVRKCQTASGMRVHACPCVMLCTMQRSCHRHSLRTESLGPHWQCHKDADTHIHGSAMTSRAPFGVNQESSTQDKVPSSRASPCRARCRPLWRPRVSRVSFLLFCVLWPRTLERYSACLLFRWPALPNCLRHRPYSIYFPPARSW